MRMNTNRLFLLTVRVFILAALAWAAAASAQSTNRYDGPDFAFLDPKSVLTAAAEVTTAKYPDCDEATVEKKMVRVYRADGTGECQDEAFTKVLTEKGKRGNRTVSLSFMLPYTTVSVPRLEVIKPNGEIVPVDVTANSKETIDDSQMSMNIFDPNSKILRVNVPKIEIGDVLHSVTRTTIERPIIPGEYSEESVFEDSGLIRHMSYVVRAPEERPLKSIALRDEVPGTVQHATRPGPGHTLVYDWEISNVPRMFDEPSMPPYEMVLQRLFVSTTPDWFAVSKWYWNLSKPHLDASSPEMKQTADRLVAGAKSDLDKTKAIFYYVSKGIRYMGRTPETDRPGFEPHDVKLTFAKKYGVCRDKAALLVALLRAAGLNSYPVLINVGTRKDQQVPDPDFNHAIVSVELKKGDYLLMDPTDENTRELLPSGDCDQSYLVCRPEGEVLKRSPVQPAEEHMMEVKTTGRLSPTGHLDATSQLLFNGVNDDAYRNMFVHMKPDDQRRFFERTLKQSMPGARLDSFKLLPANLQDTSEPVHAELAFSVDGLLAAANGKAVVNLPWLGKHLGVVNFILRGTGLDKRKYPLQTYVACGLKEDLSLKLDDGFGKPISLPVCHPVDDPSLDYHQTVSAVEDALSCSRELKLNIVEFSPAQYLELKRTLKQLDYDERKAPVLALADSAAAKPAEVADVSGDPPVETNARVLESHKELDVTDAHSARYKVRYSKQILNYAGKIREAEIKLDYNPATQDAKLLRGVVISKSGQRQEISSDEMSAMDAGWNASAKRYTGGKILVANLPGVDIGSTIEVEFEITSKNRPFICGFEAFQLADELDQKTFQLTAPAALKIATLASGASGNLQSESRTENQRQISLWHAAKVKALPAEPQLPPEWTYLNGVSYFVGDVNAYYAELNRTMLDRARQASKAGQLAKELSRNAKSRLAAVQAIRDFVAKSIREAGPSFTDLPLSELSAADTTLADGYGHAADRAILLHAMLAAAGFQPEFVLASTLPPIPEVTKVTGSFPLPQYFSSPLVRVVVDGSAYYLNDTDQYARIGSTGFDGKLGIVLATHQCETLHAAPECNDHTETLYAMSVEDNGKTRLDITRRYFGSHFNSKNSYFSELPPEERRRYFQELVSGVAQGARPIGDLVTKFDTYPGLERFSVEVDNYAVADGKYLYFDLPFTPSLFPPGADRRSLPLFLTRRSDSTVRTEISLPPAFRNLVIVPRSQTLDAPAHAGEAKITLSTDAGKCLLEHDLQTAPAIISPKEYSALLGLESTLGKKSSTVFLLQKD